MKRIHIISTQLIDSKLLGMKISSRHIYKTNLYMSLNILIFYNELMHSGLKLIRNLNSTNELICMKLYQLEYHHNSSKNQDATNDNN